MVKRRGELGEVPSPEQLPLSKDDLIQRVSDPEPEQGPGSTEEDLDG